MSYNAHQFTQYRDFIFRKMFERPAMPSETRTDEIVHNVRELSRLDPTFVLYYPHAWRGCLKFGDRMFLTRTVAAEVCMEAKINESAYAALKLLDKAGVLLFELPCV